MKMLLNSAIDGRAQALRRRRIGVLGPVHQSLKIGFKVSLGFGFSSF